MADTTATVPAAHNEKLDPAVLKISLILLVGALAPLFDTTIMNVAVNTLTHSLHTTVSSIQWVITGYLLTLSMTIPLSGWAVDRFGGRRMWMFALIVFLAGSVLSALSRDVGSLIVFRLIQGVGAGLIYPIMQTLVVQTSGGRNLGQVMSIISLPALLGPILGPVLGGIIVDNLSWQWIFFVNIPICMIALLLAWWGLPVDEPCTNNQSIDIIGILLLSPAFALFIYAICQVGSHGGVISSATIIPLAIGLLLMASFVVYALRTKNTPVIDLHLFKSRNFSASAVLLFLSGIITTGAMFLLPLFYQQVRGESVLCTGLLLIPQGAGMLLTRRWLGILTDRTGPGKIVIISLMVTIVSTLPFVFAGPETSPVLLAVALFVRGAGLGGVLIPIMVSAYQGLSREQIPQASIATRIFQQLGGAFGSAVLAVIIEHQLLAYPSSDIPAVTGVYDVTFLWLIGFTLIAAIVALFLPMRKTGLAIT
ncbi:MAG: multidrug efflux MFS transporter [Methanoregula sp.]|jgi:EmrB/QacA subfamily drug resistance transporter|uniref:MDR family MFS transporter n=1 Tax=Methanoregula sp. TaxID=2052170 RepID=UPI0025DA6C14|nr:MDR family MFS transporter [Methanoregula sp.]MCK9632111.1 multidrug efflux MFS transporter [Methanoregula sp.]